MTTKNFFIALLLIISFALTITNCSKKGNNTTNTPAPTPKTVGQSYGGGIIFYVDGSGQHGLISATTDQSTGIQWYSGTLPAIVTNATNNAIGSGQGNTTLIVSAQGAGNYAAEICDALVLNGYSDWFLPAQSELNLMYTNLKSPGLANFAGSTYWSSTENSNQNAFIQDFLNGTQSLLAKNYTSYVRAVRAF